jgi:uncharacterized membrane protein SirB2
MNFLQSILSFAVLKGVHVTAVVTTSLLFVLRGIWRFFSPGRLDAPWVRVVPHVVDTILLLSAIALALLIGNYPVTHEWLTAKVIGLVLYIVLGSIALSRRRTTAVSATAFAGALIVFGYIVSVALTKSPRGFLAMLD